MNKRKYSSTQASAIGVDLLAMIIDHGLLLTPETLVIEPNPHAANKHEEPKTDFQQTRACFTLADRRDLLSPNRVRTTQNRKSHLDLFGYFAIGLDPIDGRLLGAIPVIYFYLNKYGNSIPQQMLFHLRELRAVMIALARLEAKVAATRGTKRTILNRDTLDRRGYCLEGDSTVAGHIDEVDPDIAMMALSLFDTDRPPAWNLVDWVDIMLDFFQTADSRTNSGSLSYYQQREWRIVRLFSEEVECFRLGAESKRDGKASLSNREQKEIRNALASIDEGFFSKVFDKSSLLTGAYGVPFVEFVREIICPCNAREETRELLYHAGLLEKFSFCDENIYGVTVFTRLGYP